MRVASTLGPVLVAVITSACVSDTQLGQTWTNPTAQTRPHRFNKVVAMVVAPDEPTRRAGEDELARQLEKADPNVTAVPAYRALGERAARRQGTEQGQVEAPPLRKALRAKGYDGVVSIRITGAAPVYDWGPYAYDYEGAFAQPYYFSGFYGAPPYGPYASDFGGPYAGTYGYSVTAQTNVHDLDSGKLLWSGNSRTYDPDDVKELVAEVTTKARKDMRKRGIAL